MRRALRLDPHMSSSRLYLARNLMKQKKYDEAVEVLIDLVNEKKPSFYPDWYLNSKYAVILISQIREKQNN
ncbi:MAG: tetratricopeptide repeat protein [Thermodesulfobacteriota bacterium]